MARAGVQPAALQSGLAEVLLKRGRGEGKTSNAGIVEIEPAPPKRKETLPTGKAEANKVTASQDALQGPGRPLVAALANGRQSLPQKRWNLIFTRLSSRDLDTSKCANLPSACGRRGIAEAGNLTIEIDLTSLLSNGWNEEEVLARETGAECPARRFCRSTVFSTAWRLAGHGFTCLGHCVRRAGISARPTRTTSAKRPWQRYYCS